MEPRRGKGGGEGGQGGGRQTLGALHTPPQNGGHLRRGLGSPPAPHDDRLDADPNARPDPMSPIPPSRPPHILPGEAANPRRDPARNPPHLKWRPQRAPRAWDPPAARRDRAAPSAPRCAGRAGGQARLHRASGPMRRPQGIPGCLTYAPRRRRPPRPAPKRRRRQDPVIPAARSPRSRPAPLTPAPAVPQLRNEGEQRRCGPL